MKKYDSYKDSGVEWIGEIPRHWVVGKLKYFCEKVTDGSHYSPPTVEFGKRYLSVKDIGQNELLFDDCKKITDDEFESLVRNGCRPIKNDILLTKDGTIGRAAIVGDDNDFVVLSSLGIIRPNSDLCNAVFLREYLVSGLNVEQMLSLIQGSALTRITISIINNLIVTHPPLDEQVIIAKFLEHKTTQINNLISKKQQFINFLQEERIAVINQAVTKGLDLNVTMKDSGIEWLGEIPEHWGRARIKTLVATKVCDGPHETPEWKTEGIPFISAEAIKGNQIDLNFKRGYISIEQHLEYSKKSKVFKGDILFCKSGSTTGKSALVEIDDDFGIWSPLAIIRVNPEKITNSFMFQSIQSSLFKNQVETSWTFGTQPNIGMGALENLWIAVPPISEQEMINSYLKDELSKFELIISKTQQEIELLKEYKTALISEVVTGKIDVRDIVLN